MFTKKSRKVVALIVAIMLTLTVVPLGMFSAFSAGAASLLSEDNCDFGHHGECTDHANNLEVPLAMESSDYYSEDYDYSYDYSEEESTDDGEAIKAEGYFGNNRWVLQNNGTLTIFRYNWENMGNFSYNSSAAWRAYRKEIITVVIEHGVGSIGDYAFQGFTALTSIDIPFSVKSIGYEAFEGCTSLTSITLPDVEDMSSSAFDNCTSLTSVNLCESIFNAWAFLGCTSLTSYEAPFYSPYYCSENGILFNKDKTKLLAFPPNRSEKTYTIPNSVTSIGSYAFRDCSSLESITIPNGVTSIGDNAFRDCTSLTSITIPDGVTSIGNFMFSGCSSLTSITIPDGVTNIYGYAFYDCSSLTSITIPDGVTSIESSVFSGCSSLTSITIPDGVTSIYGYAFYGCSSLTSITIPDGVTFIGDYAFSGCTSLTSITMYEGVTWVGLYTFKNCTRLKTVYFHGTEEQWNAIEVYEYDEWYDGLLKDFIKANVVFIFPGASGTWGTLNWEIDTEGTLTISGEGDMNSFQYASINKNSWQYYIENIKNVIIADGVTSISHSAFKNHNYIEKISIPKTVKSIGYDAFTGTSSLTDIDYAGSRTDWNNISKNSDYGLSSDVKISYQVHEYDNECDTDCNVCGDTRETEHVYDNARDDECNICFYVREITGLIGDANDDGIVDNLDANAILRHDAGLIQLSENKLLFAEVTCDEEVDNLDAVAILRYDAGVLESLGHTWQEATCTEPKTCVHCKLQRGDVLGHNWKDATCTAPKTCSRCSATSGSKLGHDWDKQSCTSSITCNRCHTVDADGLGHDWMSATCSSPKKCRRCYTTVGSATSHSWTSATCTSASYCRYCYTTSGSALGHSYVSNTCTRCGDVRATTVYLRGYTGQTASAGRNVTFSVSGISNYSSMVSIKVYSGYSLVRTCSLGSSYTFSSGVYRVEYVYASTELEMVLVRKPDGSTGYEYRNKTYTRTCQLTIS